MSYTIKITYDTGDSFSNDYGVESDVGAVWEDKEEAIKALDYLEAHYKFYQSRHYNRHNKTRAGEFAKEPWYDQRNPDSCLNVPVEGKLVRISAFWTGYFEHLQAAEVVLYEDGQGDDSRTRRTF